LKVCQACPRCFVIIRKETGCNQIQCRCGTGFCYGCGAPSGSCCCRAPAKDLAGTPLLLPQLGRWLQVNGKLPQLSGRLRLPADQLDGRPELR
jgi:hypothetical protein